MTPAYRTQKAQGLQVLRGADELLGITNAIVPHFTVIRDDDGALAAASASIPPQGVFCRPCPLVPMHGFEESKTVHTGAGILERWLTTREREPEAEMLLMEPIAAVCSAIVTESGIAIGERHDGATAGRPGTWMLPFSYPVTLDSDIRDRARLVDGGWFCELVAEQDYRYAVQLRGGPVVDNPAATAWFPSTPYTVTSVIDGSAWTTADDEVITSTVKSAPKGAIVWTPGSTLISHAAVQCRTHGVAITLQPHAPGVGDVFQGPPPAPIAERLAAFTHGLACGTIHPFHDTSAAVGALCTALHYSVLWGDTRGGATALGVAVAFMLRLGMAAGWGEARHAKRPGKAGKPATKHRDHVYAIALHPGPYTLRASLPKLIKIFQRKGWSSSYGGPAWARCTSALALLDIAAANIVRHLHSYPAKHAACVAARKADPQVLFDAMVDAFNVCVHEAHNGGWWLNKFAAKNVLNAASNGTPETVINTAFTLFPAIAQRDANLAAINSTLHDALAPFLNPTHEKMAFHNSIAKARGTAHAMPSKPSKHPVASSIKSEPKAYTQKVTLNPRTAIVHAYPLDHAGGGWHFQVKPAPNAPYVSFNAYVQATNAAGKMIHTSNAAPIVKHALLWAATKGGCYGFSGSYSGSGTLYLPFSINKDGTAFYSQVGSTHLLCTFSSIACGAPYAFSTANTSPLAQLPPPALDTMLHDDECDCAKCNPDFED